MEAASATRARAAEPAGGSCGRSAKPAVLVVAALLVAGCGGGTQAAGPRSVDSEPSRRDTKIVHQDCDVAGSGAEKIDVNGDNRPDVTIVKSGSSEVCRAVDLNFDGVVDEWVYRDSAGQVTRRESDYDRDGRIDEVSIYRGGQLVEKDQATTLAGKLDSWHFYLGGKISRTERDSDGDSVVDQWWDYPKPDKPECPMIHSDVDGDGRPDPGATVDACSEQAGYVPPERLEDQARTGKSFERSDPGSLPTEVEQKSVDAPPSGAKDEK